MLALGLMACATPSPAPVKPAKPTTPGVATPSPSAETQAQPSAPASETAPPREKPAPDPVQLLSFRRELEVDVRSIAVGKPPAVAVLSDDAWVRSAGGWERKPFPAAIAPPAGSRARIFFGRDNRPRLMGTTSLDTNESRAIYLRLVNAGWRKEPGEIGRLGGLPHGGLFGVLGHDDPEVVCKLGDVCIVKRVTGWTTLPSGPGMPRVFMHDGAVWAIHSNRVVRLGENGWMDVPGAVPWSEPNGFWGSENGALWVSVAKDDALYRYEAGAWTRVVSPMSGPEGLWGAAADDVWVAGKGGLGHYDGKEWRRVVGPEGPLEVVIGGEQGEVWVGGESGLWHGRR